VDAGNLLAWARRRSGLSQDELAKRSGTSRPTLSAYEHGRKSPSLATAERIVEAAGFTLDLVPRVAFVEQMTSRGRVLIVPDALWRLPVERALGQVVLPLHLSCSVPGRVFDLRDRGDRARVYETVLREGSAEDLLALIDGVLLVDAWPELVLPREVRRVWQPLIDAAMTPISGVGLAS
jgi:transcriptional regulator with XRE-family HTH domain